MNASLPPGKYVVAVSGGVDSVALLNMLHEDPSLELVVAHFDHGMRDDSAENAAFVAGLAKVRELQYVLESVRLGPDASEDTARKHRYAFLRQTCAQINATAIVTAHHQDDVIETALINVMRGTRRRGLISLRSTDIIKRPLLAVAKQAIYEYALASRLEWYEDSTNQEMKYARNRIRARLHKRLTAKKRDEILKLLSAIELYDSQINSLVNEILMNTGKYLPKEKITTVDEPAASEIVAAWLRNAGATFDRKTIERIIQGAQELRNGSKIDVDKQYYCLLAKDKIVLTRR